MAPGIVSMEDFDDKKRAGSFFDMLRQVSDVALANCRQRQKKRTLKIKIKVQGVCSITSYHSSSDSGTKVAEATSEGVKIEDQDDILIQQEKLTSPSTSSNAHHGLENKKSCNTDNGDEKDKDWGLKPKPKSMKKTKKIPKGNASSPTTTTSENTVRDPNDLPQELKTKIESLEGVESFEKAKMYMVIEKKLYKTDMAKSANRLSMPLKQIKPACFLDDDEMKFLEDQKDWPVKVISPTLEEESLTFRQWNMRKNNGSVSSSYVLKNKWDEFRLKNGLKELNLIQVWSFRDVGNKLHFALVLVDDKAKEVGLSRLPSLETVEIKEEEMVEIEDEVESSLLCLETLCDIDQVTETKEVEMLEGVEIKDERC